MSLSGSALIDRAIQASGGMQQPQLTEADELKHVLSNEQSTHLLEAEESIFNSISSLYELYKQRFQSERESVLEEINNYIESLEDPFKKREAKKAYARIAKISIDKEGNSSPYGRLSSQRNLNLTAQDVLVLTWMGATDANAMDPLTLTEQDIEDRKLTVINTAIATCHEYGPNSPTCYGGTVHALTNSLNKTHKSVVVVMDKKLAFQLALSEVRFDIKKFFDTQSPAEKEAVLGSWGSDEPDNEAQLFLNKAKEDLLKTLYGEDKKDEKTEKSEKLPGRYTKILSKEQIEILVSTVDYVERTDLINPNLHDFIKREAKTIFEKLSKNEKRALLSDWDNSRIKFINDVEALLHKNSSDLFRQLNQNEIERTRETLNGLTKDELDPMGEFETSVSNTPEEDKALLEHHDGWSFFKSRENTLVVVIREYTPEKGYKNLLKTLLGMVSTTALAKAVVEVNRYQQNALYYLACQKNYENFKLLVITLCQTTTGEKALLQAIQAKNSSGQNAFFCAAKNQSSSNFELFVNKIMGIEGGQAALLHAMESSYNDTVWTENSNYCPVFDAFMTAARYQNKKSFINLIKNLCSTDEGKQKLLNLVQDFICKENTSDVFMIAAQYQTDGGFIFLIETMLNLHSKKVSRLIGSSVDQKKRGTASDVLKNTTPDVFNIAAQYQSDEHFIKFIRQIITTDNGFKVFTETLENTSNVNNVLNIAARYQKNGGFLDFMEIILAFTGGKDFLSLLLKNTDAISHAMNYQDFDSLHAFLTFCQDNKIHPDISSDAIRKIVHNESLSNEERTTIIRMAKELQEPSALDKAAAGFRSMFQNFGFMSSKENKPVAIHLPPQPVQTDTNVSPNNSFIETLQDHKKALEKTLEKTEHASSDHMLVMMTYARVSAVIERNEQKGDVMQSLFELEKDIEDARRNISSSVGQGFFPEQQDPQALPAVIQNVISLVDDFKKRNAISEYKKT